MIKRVIRSSPILLLLLLTAATFKPPGPDERRKAAGHLNDLDAPLRRAFTDNGAFQAKKEPAWGDWLESHKEDGQTYNEYVLSRPNIPFAERKKLYVLPIGDFDPELSPSLDDLQAYTAAYFTPLEVKMLPPIAAPLKHVRSRINGGTNKKQFNSEDIIKWMKGQLPGDAYAMIAVTMTDLYPQESWNFVFGQASTRSRVGVFSFARYHPDWHGKEVDEDTKTLVLRRSAKVLTHEMGHMFGILHCIHYECNMNGANNLREADATPMHLCPVCLRKLHHAIRFDPIDRYRLLDDFYREHGLKIEADWVDKRVKDIR